MLGSSLDSNATIKTDNGTKNNDAWYLSVDNGATWYRVSGADGASGDSFFQSVTKDEDEGYVTFTLTDRPSAFVATPSAIILSTSLSSLRSNSR